MHTVLLITQAIWSFALIGLILLHSGKDTGLSGAFGVGAAGGSGGSLMERNLNRWTIAFAVLFLVNAILLQR